ncbi:MAG: hypothetical protein Q9217_005461 [Psora testacea]
MASVVHGNLGKGVEEAILDVSRLALKEASPPARLTIDALTVRVVVMEVETGQIRAILEKTGPSRAHLHFHERITADNSAYAGIYPAKTVASHQEHLSTLVAKSLEALALADVYESTLNRGLNLRTQNGRCACRFLKPDFISVTRGPGMRAALTCGLDTAKGLAVAWRIPIVGVNHMQAHALTPRLVSALARSHIEQDEKPEFPFLSLLISGGHTLLVHSKALCNHTVLASTTDIAIGDAIDKMARSILTPDVLNGKDTMYGRILEQYAFPNGVSDYRYNAPAARAQEITPKETKWGWALPVPLAERKTLQFSFSGLGSAIKRICERQETDMEGHQRTQLAREGMRVAFEHLAGKVILALISLRGERDNVNTLVVSGGVASNGYLRRVLRSFLDVRGFQHIQLAFPPTELCTDNAAMIAWTGMEMYENGWETGLTCKALRKWSIDLNAEDGGILGATAWERRTVASKQ